MSDEERDIDARSFEGFLPRDAWPESPLHKFLRPIFFPQVTEGFSEYGWWPLRFIIALSDTEPHIKKKFLFPRVLVWDRILKKDKDVKGWKQIGGDRSLYGVLPLSSFPISHSFNETSTNELSRFLRARDEYDFVTVDVHTFDIEYRKSDTYKHIDPYVARRLAEMMKKRSVCGVEMRFVFLVCKAENSVRAGIAYESSKKAKNTYYTIGFLKNRKERVPLMVGLIHEWLTVSKEAGMKYANFGLMYKEGDPKSWQGFSTFKEKFGVKKVMLPPSLVKIVWR